MTPKSIRPAFLLIILFWPLIGMFVSLFNLEFAPPFTWIRNAIPLLSCINIPFGILFLVSQKLTNKVKFGIGLFAFVLPIVIFTLMSIDSYVSSITTCQPVPVPNPKARFICKTQSEDNYGYSYVFTIEGFKFFPLLSVIEEKQLIPDP